MMAERDVQHSGHTVHPDIFRIIITGILLVGIVGKFWLFHIGAASGPERMFSPDSSSYIDSARAIVQTGRFAINPEHPQIPQLVRTPGYPLFLAALFALLGERFSVVIASQIFLSAGTIFLTYLLAKALWHAPIPALSAAVLLSLDMPSLMSSQVILTETLFTCSHTLALCILAAMLTQSPAHRLTRLGYGCGLAITTLIRPITVYLLIPMLLLIAFHEYYRRSTSWKAVVLTLIYVGIPHIVLVGGWQVRNYRLTGQPELSYLQGANLLFYRGAGIIAQRDNISFEDAQQSLGYQEYADESERPDAIAEVHERWKRRSLDLFRQYPGFLLNDTLRGAAKMLMMPGEDHVLQYIGVLPQTSGPLGDLFVLPRHTYLNKWVLDNTGHFILWGLGVGYLGLVYSGSLLSLIHLGKQRRLLTSQHLALLGVIGYFVAVSANPGAYYRFRIPIMPILCVYAAHGWWLCLRVRTQHPSTSGSC